MSEKFNPLKTWLGVSVPKPSYYQLIGLDNFETEPTVISAAADRAITRVQIHCGGAHREQAEKLVRDLTAVKAVLLTAEKRRAYDDQLRKQLGGGSSPKLAAASPQPVVMPGALEAADSPTMMLPRGALPPMGALPSAYGAPPAGLPQASLPQAAYPPGALPPAALPPGAAPYGNLPPAALPPGALPPGALPPGAMPPQAYGYAPAAPPMGGGMLPPTAAAPQAYGAPPGPIPGYQFGPAPTQEPPPAYGAPPANPFAEAAGRPAQSFVSVRAAKARKQSQSSFVVAFSVLGVAAVVLVVVILVVNQQNNQPEPTSSALVAELPPTTPPNTAANSPSSGATSPSTPAAPSQPAASEAFAGALGSAFGGGMNNSTGGSNFGGGRRRRGEEMASDSTSPATMPAEPSASPPGSALVLKGVNVESNPMEAALPEDAARAKSVPTMLSAARTALRSRDYARAEEVILQAQITADSPALVRLTSEHARLHDLVTGFWQAVREGIKTLKEADALQVNGKPATVVRHDEVNLVIKQDGKEIALVIDKLVPALAVELAERALPKDSGSTKLVVGAFLAIDQGGDKARGRILVEESASEGIDVSELSPILSGT